MFSDKNNLAHEAKEPSFSVTIINMVDYRKILLTTNNIKNVEKTKLLINGIRNSWKRLTYPEIHVYTRAEIFYHDQRVEDIFLINDKLTIEFNISHSDTFAKSSLEKPNNIYNWGISIYYYPFSRIYGIELISDVF